MLPEKRESAMRELKQKQGGVQNIGLWIEVPGPSYTRSEGIARVVALLVDEFCRSGLSMTVASPKETVARFAGVFQDLNGHSLPKNVRFVSVRGARYLYERIVSRTEHIGRNLWIELRYRFHQIFKQGVIRHKFSLIKTRSSTQIKRQLKIITLTGAKIGIKLVLGLLASPIYIFCKFLSVLVKSNRWPQQLLKRANALQDIDCWLVLNPTWTTAAGLKRPIVTTVWDLVYKEYPQGHDIIDFDQKIQSLLSRTGATISMSDYVRDHHVVEGMNYPRQNAFTVQIPRVRSTQRPAILDSAESKRKIAEYCAAVYGSRAHYDRYLCDYPFENTKFLFSPSQIRPYKNYLRLVQAFEQLIRRKRMNLKLILTGAIDGDKELQHYMLENGLTIDVMSIRDIPSEMLTHFFNAAELTVLPSLFEGGFPLAFMESVAAGTPTLISEIPTAMEMISSADNLADAIMKPLDVSDMATKIENALRHRAELLARQRRFMIKIESRTWSDVASEYLHALNHVSTQTGTTHA